MRAAQKVDDRTNLFKNHFTELASDPFMKSCTQGSRNFLKEGIREQMFHIWEDNF